MIMGYDQGRMPYCQHYFDSRGVARVYAMDLSDGVWTLLRDSADFTPQSFAQRYTGTFSADGQRIDGRWESAGTARPRRSTSSSTTPRSA